MAKQEADLVAARELVLWAQNTYSLYGQCVSIETNLQRKFDKGIYDHTLAIKLWGYWMQAAARHYCREFGCSMAIFSKSTREAAAKEHADFALNELELGNYRR